MDNEFTYTTGTCNNNHLHQWTKRIRSVAELEFVNNLDDSIKWLIQLIRWCVKQIQHPEPINTEISDINLLDSIEIFVKVEVLRDSIRSFGL